MPPGGDNVPWGWHALLHTWQPNPGWLLFCALAGLWYAFALHRAIRLGGMPVEPVRVVSFFGGLAVLAGCLCSAVDVYAMALFWVHMIEHLTLITVVPALIVLGHPLTVLRASGGERWQRGVDRVVQRWPGAAMTHPAVGLVSYSVVIFYTHLTPFMDQMQHHPWLMPVEQAVYLVAGWMLLVGTIGEEPIRWQTPYLVRLVLLLLAMVPDTLVGIVLLQTPTVPFPLYMRMRPSWAPPGLHDLDIGASLMWALGDGLMMLLAVGIVVSLTIGNTRERLLGPWLESVRTNTFIENVGRNDTVRWSGGLDARIDDDDAALAAYNDMLRRMSGPRDS
jgi:putative copper resistance protein D